MRIEDIFRAEHGRILSTLIRLLGDFDVAEEALQEAFATGIEQWPAAGTPGNPVAWLVSADDPQAKEPRSVSLPGGRAALVCHAQHPGDVEAIGKLLATIDGGVDLAEPFNRVKEAIAEARKMGVTGRSAA